MARRPLALRASLVTASALLVSFAGASAAQACVYNAVSVVELGPPRSFAEQRAHDARIRIDLFARERKAVARRRRDARAAWASGDPGMAARLAEALVPPVVAQLVMRDSCGGHDARRLDPAGYFENWEAEAKARFPALKVGHSDGSLPERIHWPLARHARACDAEFQDRLAERLSRDMPAPLLASLWEQLGAHDLLPSPDNKDRQLDRKMPALQFASGRRGALIASPNAGRVGGFLGIPVYDAVNARISADRRTAMQRYWTRDAKGRAAFARVNAIVADMLPSDATEAAICPAATAALEAEISELEAELLSRRAPTRPTS